MEQVAGISEPFEEQVNGLVVSDGVARGIGKVFKVCNILIDVWEFEL